MKPTPEITSAATPDQTANPDLVAGRSVSQWSQSLDDGDRTTRLIAIRSLSAFGVRAREPIEKTLGHDDPAMRYLAAQALGDLDAALQDAAAPDVGDGSPASVSKSNPAGATGIGDAGIGATGIKGSDAVRERLAEMAKSDDSLSVRQAAAYALCRAGLIDDYLPLLIDRLSYPERGAVCSVAELIGKIGPPAAPATAVLERLSQENAAGSEGDYHIGGACLNALRKIQIKDENQGEQR